MGLIEQTAHNGSLDYQPSWVDRLFARLDALPVPRWLIHPAVYALSLLHVHLPVWIENVLPWGTIRLPLALAALWLVVQGGLIHYLDRIAHNAFVSFRPAMDVTDEEGVVTTWNLELGSPNSVLRRGWTRKDLQAGDKVSFKGFGGRSVTTRSVADSITLADGRPFSGASGAPNR